MFRAEIVESMIGKPLDESIKAKMKGRVVSAETRAKMSATRLGVKRGANRTPFSDVTRAKMSASAKRRKGIKHTDASKAKMSDIHRGRVFSEEHKAKLKEASRKRWSN